ncbi:MAG: hypothetical protein K5773_08205 [Pseudobutyrivibrio sp.]|nr:hypothetical protein [Pseudobutyrivibrio sp.]
MFWVSLACQLIWAFSTNQGIAVSGLMSYPVVLAMICIADVGGKGFDVLKWAVTMTSFFFMGIWVAESNGGYNDIFEHRTYVTEGAYRGIALDDTDYPMNQACYDLLTENVTEDDYLLVTFGSNSTAYLNTDAHQGVGSAYTRTHINDRLLQYWELNPENKADYVLIDTASPKYEVFQDSASAEYIYEEYPTVVDEEGSFILLGR